MTSRNATRIANARPRPLSFQLNSAYFSAFLTDSEEIRQLWLKQNCKKSLYSASFQRGTNPHLNLPVQTSRQGGVHTGVTLASRLHHAGITSRHAHTHRLHLLALRLRDLMGSFNTPLGVLTFLSEKNNQDFVWNSGIRRSTFVAIGFAVGTESNQPQLC